jgi:hypothetical protein
MAYRIAVLNRASRTTSRRLLEKIAFSPLGFGSQQLDATMLRHVLETQMSVFPRYGRNVIVFGHVIHVPRGDIRHREHVRQRVKS